MTRHTPIKVNGNPNIFYTVELGFKALQNTRTMIPESFK